MYFLSFNNKIMDDHKKFPEQVAPDKNTDRAFVKVSSDGSPQVPGEERKEKDNIKEKPVSPPPRK
jgi:hypothetical protein